jgi:hypothetical protein
MDHIAKIHEGIKQMEELAATMVNETIIYDHEIKRLESGKLDGKVPDEKKKFIEEVYQKTTDAETNMDIADSKKSFLESKKAYSWRLRIFALKTRNYNSDITKYTKSMTAYADSMVAYSECEMAEIDKEMEETDEEMDSMYSFLAQK